MSTLPMREYVWMYPRSAVSKEEERALCAWTAQAEARLLQTSD